MPASFVRYMTTWATPYEFWNFYKDNRTENTVAVLPISVAALLTTDWVARHLEPPADVERVILPGFCRGDTAQVAERAGAPAEHGPKDLRDLPEYFGRRSGPPPGYGAYDIEIIAEINHAPQLPWDEIQSVARRMKAGPNPPVVILISSGDRREYEQVAREAGARGFIAKADLTAASLRVLADRP